MLSLTSPCRKEWLYDWQRATVASRTVILFQRHQSNFKPFSANYPLIAYYNKYMQKGNWCVLFMYVTFFPRALNGMKSKETLYGNNNKYLIFYMIHPVILPLCIRYQFKYVLQRVILRAIFNWIHVYVSHALVLYQWELLELLRQKLG